MDIKEYISSGIIETYVLGIANPEEVAELESLAKQHPAIMDAITACRNDMETFAMREKIEPPEGLKSKIWKAVKQGEKLQDSPKQTIVPEQKITDNKNKPTESVLPKRNVVWMKYLVAASLAGLVISIGLNIFYKNKNEQYTAKLAQINTVKDSLNKQNVLLQTITGPDIKAVILSGVSAHEGNQAIVYWNINTKAVYLTLNNLPAPPIGKQYQLWAIVDGKPVDAGVYNNAAPFRIQKLKTIEKAEMFAITLEPRGGSTTPTMNEMYVAGKI